MVPCYMVQMDNKLETYWAQEAHYELLGHQVGQNCYHLNKTPVRQEEPGKILTFALCQVYISRFLSINTKVD
jgi:hypothetical protein